MKTFGTDRQQAKENTKTRKEQGDRQKKQTINSASTKPTYNKQKTSDNRKEQAETRKDRQATKTGNQVTNKDQIPASQDKRRTNAKTPNNNANDKAKPNTAR